MFIQIWHWKTAPWFLILRRLIGCTDESTNQKSPNFKRKITLNSKNFYLVYQYYEYMYMYSNHFFFKIHRNYSHNLLKIISFIFQISIILYHRAIQYNLIETHFKMYTAVWILYSPYLDARSDLKFSGKRTTARSLSIFQATHSYNQASFNMPRSLEKTSQIGCWVVTTTTAIDISALS